MVNEINLITCIEEVTKRQIVMKGTTYVYFDTKENVEDEIIAEATTLKTKKETEQELNKANLDYEAKVAELTRGVPETEKATWTKQELEARAYMSDANASTPMIDALSQTRGVPKDILVAKILDKADAYAVAIGTLTGARQKAEDAIATA